MTALGYHRRKQPEQVRAAVLAEAEALISRAGVMGVTLQAVATGAGVTKGGLLHHFPNKEALIQALQESAFAAFEAALARHMAADPVAEGSFSRAYIRACLARPETPEDGPSPLLMAALWTDPGLRHKWYRWMEGLEAAHAATDGARQLKLIRFAADGLWIAISDGYDPDEWIPDLLAATRQP